jgi:thiol-disulfide isomerase/thioredoxin
MICPYCHQFTPDRSYKCINCGAVVSRKEPALSQERATPPRPDSASFFKPWMLGIAALLAVLIYLFLASQGRGHAANANAPGGEMDIGLLLQKDKTNIVDFYSEYCPPCRKISPLLRKLAARRPDLALISVDINRKGVEGIDWSSPLARQYGLRSVPYFMIYDGAGNLLKRGDEAYAEVVRRLIDAGIRF